MMGKKVVGFIELLNVVLVLFMLIKSCDVIEECFFLKIFGYGKDKIISIIQKLSPLRIIRLQFVKAYTKTYKVSLQLFH